MVVVPRRNGGLRPRGPTIELSVGTHRVVAPNDREDWLRSVSGLFRALDGERLLNWNGPGGRVEVGHSITPPLPHPESTT